MSRRTPGLDPILCAMLLCLFGVAIGILLFVVGELDVDNPSPIGVYELPTNFEGNTQ